MKSKKPTIVKVANGLILMKLITLVLSIALFYFVKDVDSSQQDITSGLKEGLIEAFNISSNDMDYAFGLLIGKLAIPILLLSLALTFFYNRKFGLVVAVMVLVFIVELTKGIPLLSLIILILLLTNPTRGYLKNEVVESDVLDENLS